LRDRSAPNAATSDEPAVAGRGDVERYEQLRGAAVDGQPAGRLGLALLIGRGVAAWARAWPGAAPAATGGHTPTLPANGGSEIVGVLADMALACLDGG